MAIPNNYNFIIKDYLKKKKNYNLLDIEEKIELLKTELRINGINIKSINFHTKAEEKKYKQKQAIRRK